MCRFYMCACTDYLMSIADFFIKGTDGTDIPKETNLSPSEETANKRVFATAPKKKRE